MSRTRMNWGLGCALFLSASLTWSSASTTASFSYSPQALVPGGQLTFSGSNFNASSVAVGIEVTGSTGLATQLGFALLSGGAFSKSFTLPATVAPGNYTVTVTDSSSQVAINLTGDLMVAPPGAPWFHYAPTGTAPGGTITVTATGFNPTAVAALVAVANSIGQVTILGSAPLTAGAFAANFTVPPGQAAGSYVVFAESNTGQVANNVTGPLTVGVAPPVVGVGFYPVGIAANPLTNLIYAPNSGDNTVSVLNGATNAVLTTIPVGALPCAIGLNPRTNRIYVSNVNTNVLSVISGATNKVTATIPVGRGPCAVAVTPAINRIFVGNYVDNSVTVLDGATNNVITTVQLRGTPGGIGANTTTNRVYAANGFDNSISVIDGNTNAILAVVPVGSFPDAIGVNPVNNRVYVANFMSRNLTVINGNTNAVVATVPTGIGPDGVGVDVITNRVFVPNYTSNSVTVIDGATNAVTGTIPVGLIPDGIAVNPFTKLVYVPNSASNNVSVIQESP